MRKLDLFLLVLFTAVVAGYSQSPSNYLTITTTSGIVDASGTPMAQGTFCVYATDATDSPIAFQVSASFQAVKSTVCRNIVAGTLASALQLANPAATSPLNIRYHVTVTNTQTHVTTQYPAVSIVVPNGITTWDWSAWNPANSQPSIPVNLGPIGPAGPPNSLSIGTVASGAAAATITGAPPSQVLNLTLQAGAAGTNGTNGLPGGSLSYPGVTSNGTNGLTLSGTPSASTDAATVAYVAANSAPLTAVTVQTPTVAIPTTGWLGYHTGGDSISAGFGIACTIGTPQCYAARIAIATGNSGAWTNNGVTGDQACDMVKHAFNQENPTSTDQILRTAFIGLNDANHVTSVAGDSLGAYQESANYCMMAYLTWMGIPAANKVMGSVPTPAANWATDTTYAQTGLTTTTFNAPQVFSMPYVATASTSYSAHAFAWFRLYDSTGTAGGTFSIQLNAAPIQYVSSQTSQPMNTANAATDAIGVVDLGVIAGGTGTETITVKMVSATGTVSILGVGYPTIGATAPALWVSGVSRNGGNANGVQTATYNKIRQQQVASLQSQGFTNINFVNVRNFWMNTPADMLDGKHPNSTTGSAAIFNAFMGATASPAIESATDTTLPQVRTITSLTNCQLSGTDQTVVFNTVTAGSCTLPENYTSPLGKRIVLQNIQTGAVTLVAPFGVSGSASGVVLARYQGAIIDSPFTAYWDVEGSTVYDGSQWATCKVQNGPYTLLLADACIISAGGGVYTYPTGGVPSGKRYIFRNVGAAVTMTFAGTLGDGLAAVVNPGNSLETIARTTTTTDIVSATKLGGYLNFPASTGGAYTLLGTDEGLRFTASGNSTVALPTTFLAGKVIPIINLSTASGVIGFSGATGGNANSQTIANGQVGWLSSSGAGVWNVTVAGIFRATTGSIGGGALAAGACTSGTVAVANTTTGMVARATPVAYPGDGAVWEAYVSVAGTVTVKVCAIVAVTPTATTYNVAIVP